MWGRPYHQGAKLTGGNKGGEAPHGNTCQVRGRGGHTVLGSFMENGYATVPLPQVPVMIPRISHVGEEPMVQYVWYDSYFL